ncbi:hypothetical protein CEP53_002358 [Fusarium sp. AF-6]|nr:hypothetical protein CEP53_002358 [Fusarium sp. AF-6]
MNIKPVTSIEDESDDDRLRPSLQRSKSESSIQLLQRHKKTESPVKDAAQSAAAGSGDELWKTQLEEVQRLMKAVLLFLACIIKQETSPLPAALQPKVFTPAKREAHRTPSFHWEVVRRRLDSTSTTLTEWWKEFDSGFNTLLDTDENQSDVHKDTEDGDEYVDLHKAISDITPPLKEFATHLGSFVDASYSNLQNVDPVLYKVTEMLKGELDDLGPGSTHGDDNKDSSTTTGSSTSTEAQTEPLDHHLEKLQELQDSLFDHSISLQVRIRSEDFRRQNKPHRPAVDEASPGDFADFRHKDGQVEQPQKEGSFRREHLRSFPSFWQGFCKSQRHIPVKKLEFWCKVIKRKISRLQSEPQKGGFIRQMKRSQLDNEGLVTGESSRVVVSMSTDESTFISSSTPDDMDEADTAEVADIEEDIVEADDVDAIWSVTSAFERMHLDVTGADLALDAVQLLINLFPDSTKSCLPLSLHEPLWKMAAARSLLDSFSQWIVITQPGNSILASSLLGLLQATLIDQVLGSMMKICDHSSATFGESPSTSMSHVVSILDESMNDLLRIDTSTHLAPTWNKLKPELRSASAETTRLSSCLSLQVSSVAKSCGVPDSDLTGDTIYLPPLTLLVYLTSESEDQKSLKVSAEDLEESFIRVTPGTPLVLEEVEMSGVRP